VRCPSCRATRKLMRPEDRDFAPAYGVYASWGGRTPRQLHVASCAQCAGMTEVPFRPRDDRPVYCSDCYGDLRRKQEAQEAAEATAAAARIAGSGGKVVLEGLEGDAPAAEGAPALDAEDAIAAAVATIEAEDASALAASTASEPTAGDESDDEQSAPAE